MLFFLLCTDTTTPAVAGLSPERSQEILMGHVFRDLSRDFYDFALKDNPLNRGMCIWKGIKCQDGRITSVAYSMKSFGNFHSGYLPASVTHFRLYKCKQRYRLCTRSFPKNIRQIVLTRNFIFGTVEFAGLPRSVLLFNMIGNNLVGPLCLVNLPEHIQKVLLYSNKIKQKRVLYHNIPESVTALRIEGKNKIERIEPLYPGDEIDEDVFKGIFRSKKKRPKQRKLS